MSRSVAVDFDGVIAVLRRRGILNPELMVQAAQIEGVDLAVAATILMKETGGGRNIYGHDPVLTGGTYVKGGPVTRENYLSYRSWMRAGSGRRQGVGPCQCTSAEYQDRADVLGGCWDPLANMRSGFRGMGALIRQYGVQQGARRYNGSGAAAEAYGRDFLLRYQAWQTVLVDPAPPPEEDDMKADERDALFAVLNQLTGSPVPSQYPGWERRADLSDEPKTLVDYVRAVHAEASLFLDRREAEPGPLRDTALGHSATSAGQVTRLQNEFLRFKADTQATLAAILAAVTTTSNNKEATR